jgi:hypothetical protein
MKTKRRNSIHLPSLIMISQTFIVIGVYFLIASIASAPYASINADKGTLAGNACKVNDSSTTDGAAIEFSGSCGPSRRLLNA